MISYRIEPDSELYPQVKTIHKVSFYVSFTTSIGTTSEIQRYEIDIDSLERELAAANEALALAVHNNESEEVISTLTDRVSILEEYQANIPIYIDETLKKVAIDYDALIAPLEPDYVINDGVSIEA